MSNTNSFSQKILTISIAAYNVERFISSTLESLVSLSGESLEMLRRLEIIVVNDGSKDDTEKIVKTYVDKYPFAVNLVSKENGGYGSTINASAKVANGKYFKLLDGDDTFITENISDYIKFLDNCEADIVISPYVENNKSKGEILFDNHHEITSATHFKCDLKSSDRLFMHEMAVKTDIIKTDKFFITEHCFYTDVEFVFYCLLNSKTISHFYKPIYKYNIGVEGQSVSLTGMKKHAKDTGLVANKIYVLYLNNINSNENSSIRDVLETIIIASTNLVLASYAALNNGNEYAKFDINIKKQYPEIYLLTNQVRKLKILRESRYLLFPIIRYLVLKRMEK